MRPGSSYIPALLFSLYAVSPVQAASAVEDEITGEQRFPQVDLEGDMRASLGFNNRDERDATEKTEYFASLRLRQGITLPLTEHLQFKARMAGLVDQNVDHLGFHFQGPVGSGDITLDSLFLSFSPHDMFILDVGRLQTAFELDSVVEDSLSRHDSSGVAVDWTNGVHLIIGRDSSPKLHFITQVNSKSRSTNAVGAMGPISFREKPARLTYYLGVEFPPWGPFTQFIVDATVIPEALHPLGLEQAMSNTVTALTIKAAADWRIGNIELHPFLEAGAMVSTPLERTLDLSGGSRRADGLALVTGIDFINVGPGDLGFQAAWVQPGFLISPDYPANAYSMEVRYRSSLSDNTVLDIRYRYREDMEKSLSSNKPRSDHNVQARITVGF